MQYTAVWSENQEFIVQIGMKAVNVMKAREKNELSYLFSILWVNLGSGYYAVDAKSGEIVGGKTGTTLKAGNCLVLLDRSDAGKPYISIVMGAGTKDVLYQDMTALIEGISDNE